MSDQRPIVVGVDGSPGSREALRWAARLAGLTGAPVDVVAAWELNGLGWDLLRLLPPGYSPEGDVERSVNETIDEVLGDDRPANLRVAVLRGPAASTLLAASAQALMLIVGSRGHGGFAGLLLGSVSANVVEHAGCPVLVAR